MKIYIYLELRLYSKVNERVSYRVNEVRNKLSKYAPSVNTDLQSYYLRASENAVKKGYMLTVADGEEYVSISRVSFEIPCKSEEDSQSKVASILDELPDTFASIEIRKSVKTEVQAV